MDTCIYVCVCVCVCVCVSMSVHAHVYQEREELPCILQKESGVDFQAGPQWLHLIVHTDYIPVKLKS
jgi:hypothetical protein